MHEALRLVFILESVHASEAAICRCVASKRDVTTVSSGNGFGSHFGVYLRMVGSVAGDVRPMDFNSTLTAELGVKQKRSIWVLFQRLDVEEK
jgi:hypothetical protein